MSDQEITEIRPGVAAIIRDTRNRILLHHRRVGMGWAPISGHVEAGESLTEALHREVREETGLEVRIEGLISVNSDPAFQIVDFPDGRRVHFVTSLFACRSKTADFQGSDEGLEWAWFKPDTLPVPLLPYARVWLADALAIGGQPFIR